MALWSGFVVDTPAGKVFFAGDTGFHGGENYRGLAERHGRLRLAILPIGAYAPRWFMRPHHQDPDEAVQGMLLSRAENAAGCHWGTFQLTDEPIDEPRELLFEALDRHGVDRRALPSDAARRGVGRGPVGRRLIGPHHAWARSVSGRWRPARMSAQTGNRPEISAI